MPLKSARIGLVRQSLQTFGVEVGLIVEVVLLLVVLSLLAVEVDSLGSMVVVSVVELVPANTDV